MVALKEDSGRFPTKKDLASSFSALNLDRRPHEALEQRNTRERPNRRA